MIEPGLRLSQVFRCFFVTDQRPLHRGIDELQATDSKLIYSFPYLYVSTVVDSLPLLYCSPMNRGDNDRWRKIWPAEGATNAPYGWKFVSDDQARVPAQPGVYVLQAHFACGWGIEATGRLDPNGKPVVTSFQLFPLDQSLGLAVNSNLLKELPAGELLAEVRNSVADLTDWMNEIESDQSRDEYLAMISAAHWPGRGVRASDKTYAALAFAYLDTLARPDETKPIESLAEQMDCKRATASNRLADARANGFLTSSSPGSTGGRLTEKSMRLLGLTVIAHERSE